MIKNVLYLHGLGSAPSSQKGRFYAQRLTEHGANVRIPDLNVPDFEHLTLTAMLERVAAEIREFPAASGGVALIGSSMGGLTAIQFANRYKDTPEGKRVEKLILMAPAIEFSRADNPIWREKGHIMWYHFGYGEERPLHYGLAENVRKYTSNPVNIEIPILIYHGTHDESVDHQESVRFAQGRPNVDLRLLDSEHQLLDKTEEMLTGIVEFLGL
jgi:pimeloyl-ACP methyl ester carboxylesterase